MGKNLYYLSLIVLFCFNTMAADESQSWNQLVDERLSVIENLELKKSLSEELYSWDPRASTIAAGIQRLLADPPLVTCLASAVVPLCCHCGLQYYTGSDHTFNLGQYPFSVYQLSSMALHLCSYFYHRVAASSQLTPRESQIHEQSMLFHIFNALFTIPQSILASLDHETLSKTTGTALIGSEIYYAHYLLNLPPRPMSDGIWFECVLKMLEYQYSITGNAALLYQVETLLHKE